MTKNSEEIHCQSHAQIGRLIEQGAEALVERWRLRAMEELPTAQGAHRDVLRNDLPNYLRALGCDLASSASGGPVGSMLLAVNHGEQRWQNGWSLAEVVRDYQLLRLVIVEWLAQELPREVSVGETMAVGLALDEAIAAAVVMYVGNQEQSQLESQSLVASAKESAEAANSARERILADISHELRNPLSSILGMTQLALSERLSPELADYLNTIKDSADVLLSLLNEILDYSRLERGPLELDLHPFSLRTLIDDTLRSLALRADEKRLELAYEVAPEAPDSVVGDSMRLRQILTNLVSNAVKFTGEGEVVLTVALVARSAQKATLRFTVSDTGIGIAPEVRQSIFQPYMQADAATARHYGGTGLGLAISKELTQRMGGELTLDSEVGSGSRFHLQMTLPVAEDAPAAATSPAVAALQGVAALVIDDNATTRGIVLRALDSWGMQAVTVADSGAADAAILAANAAGKPFKLVIVDAVLRGESGFAFVQKMRRQGGPRPCVVMLFSNIDRSESAALADGLDVAGHVIKPVSAADLLETILDALQLAVPRNDDPAAVAMPALGRSLRVLVAEDTPANQKMLRLLLTKQGHQATIVDHGKAAVEQVWRDRFDVVLMDLQMPVMDGLKAVSLIRAAEKPKHRRTPIVALTAHAMQSHERRCLEAGMDAYLSKPIDAAELARVLAEVTRDAAPEVAREAPIVDDSATPTEQVIDRKRALERLGGNEELFADLAGFFLDDAPDLMRRIRTGLKSRNASTAERSAHSLKGLAANFDAAAVTNAAGSIEAHARAGQLDEASALVDACESELTRLISVLQPFRR